MRLTSNKESVAKGEVSVLAIVETLLAIALVFYLSAHFNTLRWLSVAMCVSPLLLLRTEESTRRGIDWFDSGLDYANRADDAFAARCKALIGSPFRAEKCLVACVVFLVRNLEVVLFAVTVLLMPFLVRLGATTASVCLEPRTAFQAIPKNWSRVTLAMDSICPPEVIPDHPAYTLRTWMDVAVEDE